MVRMDDDMDSANLTVGAKQREDILVSICFLTFLRPTQHLPPARSAHRLDLFRFREIILVVDDNGREDYLPLVEQIADST